MSNYKLYQGDCIEVMKDKERIEGASEQYHLSRSITTKVQH